MEGSPVLDVFSSGSDQSEGCAPRSPNSQGPQERGRHVQIKAQAGLLAKGRRRSPVWWSRSPSSARRRRWRRPGEPIGPMTGAGTGTISLDPATGAFYRRRPGASTANSGKVTVHIDGVGVPNADGTFAGSGTATIVAANGDELTGTITLTQEALPTGHTITTVVVTVTGGTGRFADASGTLTVICRFGSPVSGRRDAADHRSASSRDKSATRRFELGQGALPRGRAPFRPGRRRPTSRRARHAPLQDSAGGRAVAGFNPVAPIQRRATVRKNGPSGPPNPGGRLRLRGGGE